MRLSIHLVLFLCTYPPAIATAAEDKTVLGKDRVKAVKTALSHVVDDLERLQEDLAEELAGPQKKRLFQQADDLSRNLLTIYGKVDSQLLRERLYAQFEDMDPKIHEFIRSVKATGNRSLNRGAVRLWHADLELHFQICFGDDSPKKKIEVLQKQMHAYALTAMKLDNTATLFLPGPTATSINRLAKAAQRFEDLADKGAGLKETKAQFKIVNQAWDDVVNRIKLLSPGKNIYLLRGAARLDRLHDRMFRLLMMKGRRPVFTFRI